MLQIFRNSDSLKESSKAAKNSEFATARTKQGKQWDKNINCKRLCSVSILSQDWKIT